MLKYWLCTLIWDTCQPVRRRRVISLSRSKDTCCTPACCSLLHACRVAYSFCTSPSFVLWALRHPPQISVHEINTTQDDFVVLASDGLWDHVSNIEAVEIVRKAAYDDGVPESAGDRLVQVRIWLC